MAALAGLAAPAAAVEVRNYVLGDRMIPGRSPFGPLPVRMQGAIAAPAAPGRTPLVVVVHGLGPLSAQFLLAPAPSARLVDVPPAVVVGTCDLDTGTTGRRYLDRARRRGMRRRPVFELTLRRANHNFYNRTLARVGERRRRRCDRSLSQGPSAAGESPAALARPGGRGLLRHDSAARGPPELAAEVRSGSKPRLRPIGPAAAPGARTGA